MALEDKIDLLITAVNKLADKMDGASGGGKAASTGGKAASTGGKASTPEIKGEDVKAAILKVKAEKGDDAAKDVIAKAMGKKGAKLADLMAASAKFGKALELANAALEAADEPEGEEEEEDEL